MRFLVPVIFGFSECSYSAADTAQDPSYYQSAEIGEFGNACTPGEVSTVAIPTDGLVIAVIVAGVFEDTAGYETETRPWSDWSQVGADLLITCSAEYPNFIAYVATYQ